MSSYIWDIFARAWHFTIPALGLDRLLRIPDSYTVTFGFWFRVTSEGSDLQVTSTAMRDSPVQYSPLESKTDLRLFILHPGSNVDIVSGHIEHAGVRQAHPPYKSYEALSYVWGRADDCATILIDGACVSVTRSLKAALRQLRFPDRPRTLWVDYICINQHDTEERNHQVSRMGSIYESATAVLVWLGEATPDTAVGFKILSYFANESRPHARPIWQDFPSPVVRDGLLDIMNRSWFQRMWVVQEIGRSGRVALVCGRHKVDWTSNDCIAVRRFMRMIKYAELSPHWEALGLNVVKMQLLLDVLDIQIGNQLDKSWGGTNRTAPDLLDIAHSMRHKICADPRDKLFGIFGLVEHMWVFDDFKPDYSMTVAQTYEALARVCFK